MASDYVMKDVDWSNGPTLTNLKNAFLNVDNVLDEGNGWVNALTYMIPGFGFARGLTDIKDNLDEGRVGAAIGDAALAALSIIPGAGWVGSGLGKLAKAGAKAAKIGGREAKGVGKFLSQFDTVQDTKAMRKATKGAEKAGKDADQVAEATNGFWNQLGKYRQGELEAGVKADRAALEAKYAKGQPLYDDVVDALRADANATAVASREKAISKALKDLDDAHAAGKGKGLIREGKPISYSDYSKIEGRMEKIPGWLDEIAKDYPDEAFSPELVDAFKKAYNMPTQGAKVKDSAIQKAIKDIIGEYKAPVQDDLLQRLIGDAAGMQDYWSTIGPGGKFGRQLIRSLLFNDLNYGQQEI